MTLLACSHLVLATDDVVAATAFFRNAFETTPRFENDMFSDFVLPSGFRVAFFKPVGPSATTFRASADRGSCAFGITVADIDAVYARLESMRADSKLQLSGPPKEH